MIEILIIGAIVYGIYKILSFLMGGISGTNGMAAYLKYKEREFQDYTSENFKAKTLGELGIGNNLTDNKE